MKSKILSVFLIMVLSTLTLGAQNGEPVVMPATTLMLPVTENSGLRWLLPPAGPGFLESIKDQRICFSVDADGHAWLGFEQGLIICPEKGFKFKLSEAFWNFVHLDNGAMVIATASRFGTIHVPEKSTGKENELPAVNFQAAAMLPPDCTRMVKGAGNCLYFICNNEARRENTVYLFKPDVNKDSGRPVDFQKIISAEVPINAVAGDGQTTWVASSRLIMRIDGNSQMQHFYTHPAHPVVDLAYSADCGLFYATSFSAGFVGVNGAVEVINTQSPAIALAAGNLYLLFPQNCGILAVSGASMLKNYDRPLLGIKKIRASGYEKNESEAAE